MMPFDYDVLLGFLVVVVFPVVTVITLITLAVEKRRRRENKAAVLISGARFGADLKSAKKFRRALGFLAENDGFTLYYGILSAINVFKKIMAKTPDPLDKSYCAEFIGRCYDSMEDYEKGNAYYEEAARISPSNTYALGRLAERFFGEDFEKAEDYYKRVLFYDPAYAEAYYRLGSLYGIHGYTDKAIEQYENALRVNGRLVAPMAESAIEYAKKGDKENVFKYFALAMANDLHEYEKLEETIKLCLTQAQ